MRLTPLDSAPGTSVLQRQRWTEPQAHDSGTPTIGAWTAHHPIHFFDLADNVSHLVPADHSRFAAGSRAVRCFERLYRHRVYSNLGIELSALVESMLAGTDFEKAANRRFLKSLSTTAYDQRYYREHKLARSNLICSLAPLTL